MISPLSSRRLKITMLGAVVPPIVLALILVTTWPCFEEPPARCQISALNVSVYVNDDLAGKLVAKEPSEVWGSHVVKSKDAILVAAEVESQPEGCTGDFLIDWELSFVTFDLSSVKTSAQTSSTGNLEITLGPQIQEALGEDYIIVVGRDTSGKAMQQVSIRLMGEHP